MFVFIIVGEFVIEDKDVDVFGRTFRVEVFGGMRGVCEVVGCIYRKCFDC